MPSARIDRIVGADFLLRSRAPDARLESRLPRKLPSKSFFNGIGQNNDQSEQMFAVITYRIFRTFRIDGFF
jgi:hypothetical protein